ncbi:MAG: MDR family oxidoreductase [Verrucomicrobiales bacterium]
MSFQAIIIDSISENEVEASIQRLQDEQLPEGEVTVAVEYSTVNYKDGLCFRPSNGLVRKYPHVPGVDFAGRVEASRDPRYRVGDRVVLTGWGVGERHWGGFAQKARVQADWLVPLPDGLGARQAMAIGTAGFAAMLAILSLEEHGLSPEDGEVLVTGATGGVGSIATAILAELGYQVAAVTGRPQESRYLKSLGASRIVAREELDSLSGKPLESSVWAGGIDAVGGKMLARVIGQLKYGASVASVGLAGGAALPANVMPFLLRAVNLLGIDSVMCPFEKRQRVWRRLSTELPMGKLEKMVQTASLREVPALASQILKGEIKGRVVVDVNA